MQQWVAIAIFEMSATRLSKEQFFRCFSWALGRACLACHQVEECFGEVEHSEKTLGVGVADSDGYPPQKEVHARHSLVSKAVQLGQDQIYGIHMLPEILCEEQLPAGTAECIA